LDGAKLEDKPQEICEGIKSREEGIEELLQKISLLKGIRVCPNCQKQVAKDMVYCPYCATELPPLPEEEEDAEEEVVEEAVGSNEAEEEVVEEATEEAVQAKEESE